ncbi:FliM/FliN family flagellar motor switch protein [Enterobacteriaceae bacterium LUAb1]
MRTKNAKIKIYHADDAPDMMKLEINKLGRPYHKVPRIFNDKFDQIDIKLNIYFLKKFRVNIGLKALDFQMDVQQKHCLIFSTEKGNLAFYIDRILLLNILHDYYGLTKENQGSISVKEIPISKTEDRLKNKLALELISLIVDDMLFGMDLTIKADPASLMTHWSYRVDFSLDGYDKGRFSLLLDAAHVDRLLAVLRQSQESSPLLGDETTAVKTTFMTLPIRLTGRLINIPMTIADLYPLKRGDILSVALPDSFPIYIGKQPLFNAIICEDRGKLFLSEFSDRSSETNHE